MTTKFLMFVALLLIALVGINCDLGINPLLFDGSPVSATFRVDAIGSAYDSSVTVDLGEIVKDIDKDIDSIKVYNITLQIDSTAGTNLSTTVSGAAVIDGNVLLTISNAPISEFASERSIFDSTVTGGPIFVNSGVAHLVALLHAYQNTHTLPTITLAAAGTASTSNLHFTIKLRLYTQVFLPPPKD